MHNITVDCQSRFFRRSRDKMKKKTKKQKNKKKPTTTKTKQYHSIGTVSQSNREVVET